MKILFVSAVYPYPLYSGGQVRIYNLLKEVSRHHEVTLMSFIRDPKEEKYRSELPFVRTVHTALRGRAWQPRYLARAATTSYPFLFSTYTSQQMKDAIAQELAHGAYDLVHIEPGYVWPAMPATTLPIVVSEHNIEHHVYEGYTKQYPWPGIRMLLSLDVGKMKRWERIVWERADGVTTVSEDDKQEVMAVVPEKSVTVVPNGVDVDEFVFQPKKQLDRQNPVFLFVGNFRWVQNRDALKYLLTSLWPEIRAKYDGATLRIVGRHLPESLRTLLTKHTLLLEKVEDIQSEFHDADIMLAPIYVGGGTKFKILEAMASGIPIVTTPLGVQGLAVEHGNHLFVANTTEEYLQAIETVLDSQKDTVQMVTKARTVVEQFYSWSTIGKILENVWKKTYARK